jgi:hypothetical protein
MRVAVLSGDLIRSSDAQIDALDRTMAELSGATENFNGWNRDAVRFTRFRGDGWQMRVADPDLSLRLALYLLARLRSKPDLLGTRISIGIGPESYAGSKDLSDARGKAFELSGRGLDKMGPKRRLVVAGQGLTRLHPVVAELLEQLARKWTVEQAEAVNYRLSGGDVQVMRNALAGWEEAFELFAAQRTWTA